MGRKFKRWQALSGERPASLSAVADILLANRQFTPITQLTYGDYGLTAVVDTVAKAITDGKRIGLYADYDVDGTMSCVSWIWFLEALGHKNFIHYIPCRFKEGYGLNLKAIEHLIDHEGAELIITMDTGITANAEAAYCRQRGVEFICTDHHVIQPEKMPDCIILNPKMHPDEMYKELCGCGITFVLLRKLGERLGAPASIWTDLLALTGMATICDVVPLNGVNHRLAKLGVAALSQSKRPVLRQLMAACQTLKDVDEKDVGFRLGPRINAVGRLEHADLVIEAFIGDDPKQLIEFMDTCNEQRKKIQRSIVESARREAMRYGDAPILFLGGDWHPGVVGIAASKIAEEFWRPVWLFQRKDDVCKGSARSLRGFDVTAAMSKVGSLFTKFGGHAAAGGFTFPAAHEEELRAALTAVAQGIRDEKPEIWESQITYDCEIAPELATLALTDELDGLKPFGHGFEEPRFALRAEIASTRFFNDKETGEPRHTCVMIRAGASAAPQKVMFFNEVHTELTEARAATFIVAASRSTFRGEKSLTLYGHDFEVEE
ncbi:MAG: DHHA1 domain-containing protein [Proteobacteria bacterium]|nr:DHHA1 domain-containing protein [Pseudomonadota bacterium]